MVSITVRCNCLELVLRNTFLLRGLNKTVQYVILLLGQDEKTCRVILMLLVWPLL